MPDFRGNSSNLEVASRSLTRNRSPRRWPGTLWKSEQSTPSPGTRQCKQSPHPAQARVRQELKDIRSFGGAQRSVLNVMSAESPAQGNQSMQRTDVPLRWRPAAHASRGAGQHKAGDGAPARPKRWPLARGVGGILSLFLVVCEHWLRRLRISFLKQWCTGNCSYPAPWPETRLTAVAIMPCLQCVPSTQLKYDS